MSIPASILKPGNTLKLLLLAFVGLITISILAFIILAQEGTWFAPELFGGAGLAHARYFFWGDKNTFGLATGDLGTWLLLANDETHTCNLRQILGARAGNYDQYGNENLPWAIPCKMSWKGERFSGWIYFRTHNRKFCGGQSESLLPHTCMLFEP